MKPTDEIKSRVNVVDFIGSVVQLKKSGRNYKGLCPFHTEKTPSFVIFPDSQQWRCFGSCGEGGDIFNFVMKHEGWDFTEALRYLADYAGVELAPPTPQQAEAHEQAERLTNLLFEAAAFYHRQLLTSPGANIARAYVERRGLLAETLEHFQVGYSPDSWNATLNTLLEKGFVRDDLIEAGLLVERDDGRVYDRFRNRLMIPIRNARGDVVGFGARALEKDAVPKYLNSPQNALFNKSELLYGLSYSRRTIRETETAIIVEGYMDVMQAHQAGFTDVVAQMGTALTEQQLGLLAPYAGRLVLALDPDAAGQMATDRGREVIERVSRAAAEQFGEEGLWDLDTAEHEYRTHITTEFDARGMLRYESRLGFDIRVIILPAGQDPDDLIREAPQTWAALVANALPIVEYVIQKKIEERDLNDPKVKSEIAREIIPLIQDIADPVERSHYIQRLTRLLKVPENTLFPGGSASTAPSPPPLKYREAPPPSPYDDNVSEIPVLGMTPTRNREEFCLAALIQYPRLIYQINRVLAEFLAPEEMAGPAAEETLPGIPLPSQGLDWRLTSADFGHPDHRNVFDAWIDALDQDELGPYDYLLDTLTPSQRQLVDSWQQRPLYALLRVVTPPDKELSEDVIFEASLRAVLYLRKSRLYEYEQQLTFLLEATENGGDSLTVGQHGDTIKRLFVAKQRVEKAIERYGHPGSQIGDDHQRRFKVHNR